MRHSKREAERTYDRRTSVERKRQALSFAHHQVNRFEDDEDDEENEMPKAAKAASSFELGQFVGCACVGSTLDKPDIMLGRIQHKNNKGVELLWYKNVKDRKSKHLYKLCLDSARWNEKRESLVSVIVSPTSEIDTVLLKTDAKDVHRAIFCD